MMNALYISGVPPGDPVLAVHCMKRRIQERTGTTSVHVYMEYETFVDFLGRPEVVDRMKYGGVTVLDIRGRLPFLAQLLDVNWIELL